MEEFFAGIPKQPPIQWSTSEWNGPIIELDPDDPFGDMKRLFSGRVASNSSVSSTDNPQITLESLIKMNDEFQKQFPIPVEYKNGADMSRETFEELGKSIKLVKPQGKAWLGMNVDNFIGVEIHIVESVPFGCVEKCRCHHRKDFLDAIEFREKK